MIENYSDHYSPQRFKAEVVKQMDNNGQPKRLLKVETFDFKKN